MKILSSLTSFMLFFLWKCKRCSLADCWRCSFSYNENESGGRNVRFYSLRTQLLNQILHLSILKYVMKLQTSNVFFFFLQI